MRKKANKSDSVTDKSTDISEHEFVINRESYSIVGYLIDGQLFRRHPNRDKILDDAIKHLKKPDCLVESISKDSEIMYKDASVELAVYILRDMASGPKTAYTKKASKYLRAIKRTDLLPKGPNGKPEKNKTENEWLYLWKHEPEDLILLVDSIKKELLGLLDSCTEKHGRRSKFLWTPRRGRKAYECCIKHAYKTLTGEEPGIGDLYPFRYNKDIGVLALIIISSKYGIPYDALRTRYYDISDNGKLKQPKLSAKEQKLQKESGFERINLNDSD